MDEYQLCNAIQRAAVDAIAEFCGGLEYNQQQKEGLCRLLAGSLKQLTYDEAAMDAVREIGKAFGEGFLSARTEQLNLSELVPQEIRNQIMEKMFKKPKEQEDGAGTGDEGGERAAEVGCKS